MKYTSNQANKLLKSYQIELEQIQSIEAQSIEFKASSNENIQEVKPEYDLIKTTKKIEDIQNKIRTIKHAINVFNTTTVLEEVKDIQEMTIDEALIYLPQMNLLADKLKSMSGRLAKSRCNSFSYNSMCVVEYKYTNYDPSEALKEYNRVKQNITRIQTALDTINNTVAFEIPE